MRRLLQVILVVVASLALVTGGWGLVGSVADGYGVVIDPERAGHLTLDSNMRYFSGLWIGAGLVLLVVARSVERHRATLRALALLIFLGGVGRLVSMVDLGVPPWPYVLFTVLELAFPTLLLLLDRVLGDVLSDVPTSGTASAMEA